MKTEIGDLQIGKAGEYLVCADLILKGFVTYPSEQGLPYDVVMDVGGKLLKVQVKTTRNYKEVPQRRETTYAYIFNIGRNGKANRRSEYRLNDVDLFALVALDKRIIAYIPNIDIRGTMNFRVPEFRGNHYDEKGDALKKRVTELRDNGMSCKQISNELDMPISNVYKYSGNLSIKQKKPKPRYMNEFDIDKCLWKMDVGTVS